MLLMSIFYVLFTSSVRDTVLTLLTSRKEKQNEFFALFRWARAQGRDLPAHPGYSTNPLVPSAVRHPLIRA